MKINAEKFEKYTPPGIDCINQLKLCLAGLSAAMGWSVSYIAKYLTARANLFEYSLTGQVLREGARIANFNQLIHDGLDSLDGFLMFYIVMLGLLVYYYLYYYQGSKSIYLMRRLPNRWEMYRRCIALPFAAIVTGVITEIALLALYYGIYLTFTPQQCLPF
ncbi:MAG: hypothetical protein IJZ23_05210 [Roseburia sp.]|nr:hypothetical protein [Roseburia sp.]